MSEQKVMPEDIWNEFSLSLKEIATSASEVNGIFVECGVHQGSTAKILLESSALKKKEIYLFDSWEGLPETSQHDNNDFYHKGDWNIDIKFAEDNLYEYIGNLKRIHFKKGWFPEKFNDIKSLKIALLHLDCSLYESTKLCLEHFWDQVSEGGYVVCNSHDGYSVGPEKAFKEFFENKKNIQYLSAGLMLVVK